MFRPSQGLHQFSNSSITEENQDERRTYLDIDIDISLVYFTKMLSIKKNRSKNDVKRDNLKYLQTAEIIIIKNLIFWPLKLTTKAVKICLNFIPESEL